MHTVYVYMYIYIILYNPGVIFWRLEIYIEKTSLIHKASAQSITEANTDEDTEDRA